LSFLNRILLEDILMVTDANKRHYFSPIELEEFAPAMRDSKDEDIEATIWEKGKSDEDTETYVIKRYEAETEKLFLKIKGNFLSKLTGSSLTNKNILLKINHAKFHYFTSGMLALNTATNEYFVHLSEQMMRSQQRTSYRIQANKHNKIIIKMNKKEYEGLDISAGGACFIISIEEKEDFFKDKVFPNCKITYNDVTYQIPEMIIAGVWDQQRSDKQVSKVKIGLSFEKITQETDEALCKHINKEARLEEIRKSL
jgi:hypothetical protein